MKQLVLFAQRHREINEWLGQNPLILGLIFLTLGVVLGGWGLYELNTGVAHSKYGREIRGGRARLVATIRIVAGVGCILFALFRMLQA